jgi:hypothetical protein
VDEGPPLELEQRLLRVPTFVLSDGVLDGLAGQVVLQLDGGKGQPVHCEEHIHRIVLVADEFHLPR